MNEKILSVLSELENYRLRIEKGLTTAGSVDHVIRMCQAKIANDVFENRNDWAKYFDYSN